MLKVKADILPFLIFLTYLILAEKIVIVNTYLVGAVKYREKNHMTVISASNLRSISNGFTYAESYLR